MDQESANYEREVLQRRAEAEKTTLVCHSFLLIPLLAVTTSTHHSIPLVVEVMATLRDPALEAPIPRRPRRPRRSIPRVGVVWVIWLPGIM